MKMNTAVRRQNTLPPEPERSTSKVSAGVTTIACARVANVTRRAASVKCRARILDVDRMGRERHDARPAGETPSAFLVEGARSKIFGERPEARFLNIRFAKPDQSQVVKRASDASTPELWHHIQGLHDAVAHRHHSDGLVVLERN